MEERIDTPGALTSGFSRRDDGVGPDELKSASSLPEASGSVTARTVMARSEVPGRDQRPRPTSSKSFPAATTGTTPAAAAASSARATMSREGSTSGSPSREVDHVHPVLDGGLDRGDDLGGVAVEPDVRVRGDGERLVVADVRLRGDAGDLDAAGGGRAGVAGGDAGDVGRVPRLDRVEGLARVLPGRARGRKARATMTLAVVYAVCPFGKPGGIV